MNNDVKKYIKECKYLLSNYGKKEKQYLDNIKENIGDFDISYDEIVNRLGTPKDIVIEYYEQQDIYDLIKKSRLTRMLRKMLIILLVLLASFFAYKSYIYQETYNEVKDSYNGYFEEVIE